MRQLLFIFVCSLILTACVTNRTLGTGVDDQTADIHLKRLLLADNGYNYNDVDIVIFEGRMMLTGTVASVDARQALSRHAGSIPTVREVLNEVVVGERTPFGVGITDAVLDRRLGTALLADSGVYSANYQIAISQGHVYLLGLAQGPEELRRVTEHARHLNGVKSVISHVIFVGDPRRQN